MHELSGIITSFKYTGALPFVYLVGDYAIIPLDRGIAGYKGYPVEPFEELSNNIVQLAKELSYSGSCAFIEASYFGGAGYQCAIVWKNGKCVYGPVISYDNLPEEYINREFDVVSDAINHALEYMEIRRCEELDEFDTARLGHYRSNEEIINEFMSHAT